MKKLLLSFLICSSLLSFAQDWNPFPLGQSSFYHVYINDTSIHVLHPDTIINRGSFQTMFFSSTDENYGNCYSSVYFNPYQEPYPQSNRIRPDSINIYNDSLFFFFKTSNTGVYDSILFFPKSAVGESWFSTINIYGAIFNKIQFTCDSIYFDTVLGNITDSLKIISIQAYDNSNPVSSIFDNQKIILSKNYGYKNMVVYSGQINTPASLIGLSSNTNQEGFYYPDFTEYFHLNVGDIVIWKEDFQGNIVNPSYIKYYKDSITASFLSTDSVFYTIQRHQAYSSIYSFNQTYLRRNFEWLKKPTSLLLDASEYPNPNYMELWETYPISTTNNHTIINREVDTFGNSLDTNNCGIGTGVDMYFYRQYNTKFGFTHSIDAGWFVTSWSIIGSTINGSQEGVLWSTLVTGIDNFENISNVKIYPNPSQSGNFILESEYVDFIELVCIDGKIVFTQTINQPKTEIKTDLPKGLYFAKLTFENKKQVIQKLIITD